MNDCSICRYWDLGNRIQTERRIFIKYLSTRNVANFFTTMHTCPTNCSKLCCSFEIQKFLSSEHSIEFYQNIIDQATDLVTYEKWLYSKALIAESRIGQDNLAEAFVKDNAFNLVLNRQKIDYFNEILKTRPLSEKEKTVHSQLTQELSLQPLAKQWYQLVGNSLQILAIAIQSQEKLQSWYKEYQFKNVSQIILNYLDGDHLRPLIKDRGGIIWEVFLAKLEFKQKIDIIYEGLDTPSMFILAFTLTEGQTNEILKKRNDKLPIPVHLKLLTKTRDLRLLRESINSKNPYIRAIALYQIYRVDPSYRVQNWFVEQFKNLYHHHNLFTPILNYEEKYYELIMDNPHHELVNFAIHMIFDLKLLEKLHFHTELRNDLRERIEYLHGT